LADIVTRVLGAEINVTSRHLIDPDLTAWLDVMPRDALMQETLPARRKFIADTARTRAPPLPDTVPMLDDRTAARAPHGFPLARRAQVVKTFERDSREALRRALVG
jgi:hypothetical protein